MVELILFPFSIAALHGIFQDSGLEACEEDIITLDRPSAREELSLTVVDGINNCLTAALGLHELDQVESVDEIQQLREKALGDLHSTGCYYCYDAYVILGRKAGVTN